MVGTQPSARKHARDGRTFSRQFLLRGLEDISVSSHLNSLQVLLDGASESRLWHSPDDSVKLLATFEDHDSGDAADTVLGGNARALIGVELNLSGGFVYHTHCFVSSHCTLFRSKPKKFTAGAAYK